MQGILQAGLILALAALAGCGFRPLYGEDSAVGKANLSGVRVTTIQDVPDPTGRSSSSARAAQQLRSFLIDRVNPRDQQGAAQFELRVTLAETKFTTIGIRTDETATRGTLVMNANYVLVRYDGGGPILSGTTRSDVSYNILRNEFATLSAENDARRRAVREVSDTIALEAANAVGAFREGVVK
jgi:LPS-assembly lipoprotein